MPSHRLLFSTVRDIALVLSRFSRCASLFRDILREIYDEELSVVEKKKRGRGRNRKNVASFFFFPETRRFFYSNAYVFAFFRWYTKENLIRQFVTKVSEIFIQFFRCIVSLKEYSLRLFLKTFVFIIPSSYIISLELKILKVPFLYTGWKGYLGVPLEDFGGSDFYLDSRLLSGGCANDRSPRIAAPSINFPRAPIYQKGRGEGVLRACIGEIIEKVKRGEVWARPS